MDCFLGLVAFGVSLSRIVVGIRRLVIVSAELLGVGRAVVPVFGTLRRSVGILLSWAHSGERVRVYDTDEVHCLLADVSRLGLRFL